MKVELSIKDDSELRNLVKDMIRSQVTSTSKEYFDKITLEDLSCLTSKNSSERLDKLTRLVNEYSNTLKERAKQLRKGIYNENIQKVIIEVIKSHLKEPKYEHLIKDFIQKAVTDLVAEKLNDKFK